MSRILFLMFLPIVCSSCGNTQSMSYTMDMFSLISFSLAIASILFGGFAIWFSWELYKKSTSASDRIQETAIRIESTVVSIKGDITEIVKRAVSYWVDDNPVEAESTLSNPKVSEKLEELTKTIDALSKGDPKIKELEGQVNAVLEMQKLEIAKLSSSLLDAKVKNIFPSANTSSAISVQQQILENTNRKKSGQLLIRVNRPVKIATASGKFSPSFTGNPILSVKLVSSPYSEDSNVNLNSGIGQFSDFHIHLKVPGNFLLEGEYVVEYDAQTNGH